MRKSLKKAKQDALAVWRYIAEHGVRGKTNIPFKLLRRIKNDNHLCPLCEMFGEDCENHAQYGRCPLSPIGIGWCCSEENPYNKWANATRSKDRAAAAREIVKLIEAWEV